MSEKDNDSLVKVIERFSFHVCEVAIHSECMVPPWQILSFIYSATQSVLALIPAGYESEKATIQSRCLEMMLILSLGEKTEMELADQLFDQLCSRGFSSEHNAVSCVENYCGWLISHGQDSRVEKAFAAAKRLVSQPSALADLQMARARVLQKIKD